MAGSPLPSPKGTRDFYPIEMARRRWIEDKWRRVAIRHGFEEIDGPTFEQTELYTRKSGDGIVGEIFGVYSGKDEEAVKAMGAKLAAGERGAIAPFALRPEFTPTLARMYAARAKQLPQPCKWFWQGPCFRAERPQRGRLREFWQWNCDILGGDNAQPDTITSFDAEAVATCIGLMISLGLSHETVQIKVNNRLLLADLLNAIDVPVNRHSIAMNVLDQRSKLEPSAWGALANNAGLPSHFFAKFDEVMPSYYDFSTERLRSVGAKLDVLHGLRSVIGLTSRLDSLGLGDWYEIDVGIVRGLAYYTGTVFEVIVDGERAVAGGGRYDNLIETFGGPPTPAVGFGMGDVVLSLVLQDKGLMPTDAQIARDLGLRPDAFVISNGSPESDAAVAPLLAELRRGGLHARRSYKSTKNIGKLLKDAADAGARFALIIEGPDELTLKDLDGNTQDRGPRQAMLARLTPPARC